MTEVERQSSVSPFVTIAYFFCKLRPVHCCVFKKFSTNTIIQPKFFHLNLSYLSYMSFTRYVQLIHKNIVALIAQHLKITTFQHYCIWIRNTFELLAMMSSYNIVQNRKSNISKFNLVIFLSLASMIYSSSLILLPLLSSFLFNASLYSTNLSAELFSLRYSSRQNNVYSNKSLTLCQNTRGLTFQQSNLMIIYYSQSSQ
uniref:Transmembrane protein n=1 Tax=Trepomonas sp. PC1 TaxID=1076344 RepID=A0A146JXG4_9EUKA|eukprot:JAP89332.1 Hypothetical protein TPC1_31173 [Trepomonas sp. PC1]